MARSDSTPLAAHVTELARQLRRSPDGSSRLVVRLDPGQLGSVTLALRAGAGGAVHMSLQAASADSAASLHAQQQQIRDVLTANGFHLEGFTVSSDGAGTFSGSGSWKPEGQQDDPFAAADGNGTADAGSGHSSRNSGDQDAAGGRGGIHGDTPLHPADQLAARRARTGSAAWL
jgi:flagellar hook-length control protein FliK